MSKYYYYIGLDGGSTYLKAAMLHDGQVVDTLVHSTGIDNSGTAEKMVKELCQRNNVPEKDIGYIMATGYSRKVLEIADDDISEIRKSIGLDSKARVICVSTEGDTDRKSYEAIVNGYYRA